MQSIWLERANQVDKYWVQLFEDCGIKNDHQFICNVSNVHPSKLIAELQSADQICFFSSMTTPGIELVEQALNAFISFKWKDKKIISGGYLLERLNQSHHWDINVSSYIYTQVFEDNEICEMHDAMIKRIQWNNADQQYVYTNVASMHKSYKN